MIEDEKIGRLLVREGVITEDQLRDALEVQSDSFGKTLGEILMNLKYVSEVDLLRILAKKFHTQFLTTNKLSELKVPEAVLKMVPLHTAEKRMLFPVQYRKSDKSLTIVMANPQDMDAIDEVKFVSGTGNVKTLVGMDDAIKAAINKWFKNDEHAFGLLLGDDEMTGYELPGSAPSASDSLATEDDSLDLSRLMGGGSESAEPEPESGPGAGGGAEEEVYLGGMTELPGDNNQARDQIVIEDLDGPGEAVEEVVVSPLDHEPEAPEQKTEEQKPARRADVKKYRLRMLVVEPHDQIRKFIHKLFSVEGFKVKSCADKEEALAELAEGEYDSLVIKDRDMGEGEEFANLMAERFPGVELCSIKDYGSSVIGETRAQWRLMSSFLETLDIMMGMLEMESGGMSGHHHNVGKYSRLIAAKLDLPRREVDAIALAGFVHDLGKKNMPHVSLLEIDKAEPEKVLEQAKIPLKLLAAAKLPLDIAAIIRHQFERWDGKGIPDGLAGEDIPIGSRILALVETFEDLTNKSSAEQKAVEPTTALELMKKHQGSLFDPALVDIFIGLVKDDIYLQQMAGAKDLILIADNEPDFTTLLELRLINQGFSVASASRAQEALEKAKSKKPSLIVTEAEFEDFSGFEMVRKLKEDPETRDIPFLFTARKDDTQFVTQGFRLGAEDYMIKPVKIDILAAKISNIIARLQVEKKAAPAAAGVSGSLTEMSLPDIIQILGVGRKTGRITLEDEGKTCTIDMEEGQVINAALDDLRGEEAFYQILYWSKGSFSINPSAELSERLITLANDSLMLEGFRRMDEAARGEDGAPEDELALDGSDFI